MTENTIEELKRVKAQLAAVRKAMSELKDVTDDDYDDVKEAVQKVDDALAEVPNIGKLIAVESLLNTDSGESADPSDDAEEPSPSDAPAEECANSAKSANTASEIQAASPSADSSLPAVIEAEVVDAHPALLPAEREVAKRRKGEALTNAELRLMLQLRDDGLTQTEIAKRLNCSQVTISRLLREWTDTTYTAKAVLKRDAAKMAEKLTSTATNEDILEIFDREEISVKKRKDDGSGSGVNVMIGIKLPGAK